MTKCPTCGGDYIYDTTVLPRNVETFEENDLMDWLKHDTGGDLDLAIDVWGATNRIFVSDLPWYQRFLIWLFPRMYILEKYNP